MITARPKNSIHLLRGCSAVLLVTVLTTISAAAQTVIPPKDDAPRLEEQAVPAREPRAPMRVTESVTVVATGTAEQVRNSPVPVTVVGTGEIQRQLMSDTKDLVRWIPGVYVANDSTRYGLNGFNIRGIGGNRVQTQVDGVRTAEQFDFGPVSVTQYALDLEALKSVEVVRSAGSALYGSDALGGVVSYLTKDPGDYLAESGRSTYVGGKVGYDGRRAEFGGTLAAAIESGRFQVSLFGARRDGTEVSNKGTVETESSTRTAPNPQQRRATNVLGKVVYRIGEGNDLKLSGEWFDGRTKTEVYSSQGTTTAGASRTTVSGVRGDDQQERFRIGLEQNWRLSSALVDEIAWHASFQKDQTEQDQYENRLTVSPTATTQILRSGLVTWDQQGSNANFRLKKKLGNGGFSQTLTLGGAWAQDDFDMLRNRMDVNGSTGALAPSFPLVYPTKYFPKSISTSLGLFFQDEISISDGLVRVTPGIRWDRYALDADENDATYLSGNAGIEPPVDMNDSALSPRVGLVVRITKPLSAYAQYAEGFRAPAYSNVNNGFTNVASGYTTLPNPGLRPEYSHNLELGLRTTLSGIEGSIGVFDNRYEDFIEIVSTGVNPSTGLLEFQAQNVTSARIRGVEAAVSAWLGRWSARATYAYIDGENSDTAQPLNSIPPNRLVLGVGWSSRTGRAGAEVAGTIVAARGAIDATSVAQFRPPAYAVVDLTAFYDLTDALSVQAGVLNLLDEKYWTWSDVQGVSASSPVLDRYTSPGRSMSLALRWRM